MTDLADAYSSCLWQCSERKIELHQLLGWAGPLTHRQNLVWQEWRGRQWNEPSLTDHYLMQLSHLLVMVNSTKKSTAKLDDFRLKFRRRGEDGVQRSPFKSAEEAAAASKFKWFALLGLDAQGRPREDVVRKDAPEEPERGPPRASPRPPPKPPRSDR